MVFREIVKGIFFALLGICLFLILVFATSCAFAQKTENSTGQAPTVKWYIFKAKQGLFIRNKMDRKTLAQADLMICTERRYIKELGETLHLYQQDSERNK